MTGHKEERRKERKKQEHFVTDFIRNMINSIWQGDLI